MAAFNIEAPWIEETELFGSLWREEEKEEDETVPEDYKHSEYIPQ